MSPRLRASKLARGAGGRVADLAVRQFVEQELARFAAWMRGENFAAKLAEIREPWAQIGGQLLVDFTAQALREGGAFAGSRDGDLQIAAADHGAEEEIAVGNVVDAVAEDVALDERRGRRRR